MDLVQYGTFQSGLIIAGDEILNYGTVKIHEGSYITSNTANYGGGIWNNDDYQARRGKVTFKDSAGNIIATWPGYDSLQAPMDSLYRTTHPMT